MFTDPASDTFNLHAVPTLLTAAALWLLGLIVLYRERLTPVSRTFLALVATISIWQFSFPFMACSVAEPVALTWAKLATWACP